jgi:hypothetical protein
MLRKGTRGWDDLRRARWSARWLDETPVPTLEDAQLVVALLTALGRSRHEQVLADLRDVAAKSTSR